MTLLNGEKCQYELNKRTVFGDEITSDGVNLSPEKVEAVKEAKPPKTAAEAKLFIGSVQFSAQFMPNL